MPKGQPDYGLYAKTSTITGVSDLGELAARIGSIDTFDRGGNVIWLDDFEEGIEKWRIVTNTGDRGSFLWSPEKARNGGFSMKLSCGDVTDDILRVDHSLSMPVISRIGLEFSMQVESIEGIFAFTSYLYDGETQHRVGIRYARDTEIWQYYDITDVWRDLTPTLFLGESATGFHTIKLVVDFATGYYVKLMVGNAIFDLSAYQYYKQALPFSSVLNLNFELIAIADEASTVFVDDVIVTQNEP